MIEFILYLSLVTFGTLFGMSLINLRKLEIENKNLRQEITETHWSKIKN